MRRTVEISRPMVRSATSSVSTSGVLVTTMPLLAGPLGVDLVIADAEGGDDLERRQFAQQGLVHRGMSAGRDSANSRPVFRQPCVPVADFPKPMDREQFGDLVGDHRKHRGDLQNFGTGHG